MEVFSTLFFSNKKGKEIELTKISSEEYKKVKSMIDEQGGIACYATHASKGICMLT